MAKNQNLFVVLGGPLLLVCGVASTHAQSARLPGVETFKASAYAKLEAARPAEMAQPGVFELRCRGGENRFQLNDGVSIVGRDRRTHYNFFLEFKANSSPARRDGMGLEPGTCSWIDRPLSSTEPKKLYFDARPLLVDIGRAQEQNPRLALSEYFKDPGHFWSFFIYNTDQGHFQVTNHKILIDPRKVGVEQRRQW